MEDNEDTAQHNMISNLPLLFANGYPTSLDKISESRLQNFIPFMVQCSLGQINVPGKDDFNEPEWWPEDVKYSTPFVKPRKFQGNWLEKMKSIVEICYRFHKSKFLLRFCKDLASYEHASLRFINNQNSTTSLFDRRSNKLLVTFRNENMSYDQPQRSRKCLLQQKSRSQYDSNIQHMVESAPFDIYLCDNCDAELYSHEAILEHEKTCTSDENVIICDSPEPESEVHLNLSHTSTENKELCAAFMLNFNLQDSSLKASNPLANATEKTKEATPDDKLPAVHLKRLPRSNRAVHSLSRCPTIPLSSPAGKILIKNSKTIMTDEYLLERLDRLERFCHAPILSKTSIRPKYMDKKVTTGNVICTFKKPQDYRSDRPYTFPKRQFSVRRSFENSMFLNSLLMRRCRPMSIRLKKINESEIKRKRRSSHNLNIKLKRDNNHGSNWKISAASSETIVDTIDLCSSDDDNVDGSYAANNTGSPSFMQTIFQRLNSEITLTPIAKSMHKNASSEELSSAAGSARAYQGNFVLSPTLVHEAPTSAKPLQPSVLYFSNYTTKSIANAESASTNNNEVSSSTGLIGRPLAVYQNQENVDNVNSKSPLPDSWSAPDSSVLNSMLSDRRSSSTPRTSLQIMQFKSPNRIVSIDLTS